ncbi:MAG: FkbM family methyltransferase [Dehalococcoidia bacterium]
MNRDDLTRRMKTLSTRGLKAARLVGTPRWRTAMRQGVAATVEHDRLPLDRNYRTVIDVGANRGQFALYARERFPEARIYSIEPLSGPRASIRRLFEDDARVQVLDFAAGASEGSAVINITHHDDSSSLLPPSELQTSRFPGTYTETTETVKVRSLDDALADEEIARPVLLKIDVQGFELEVLKGATKLLSQVDAVMTECSFVEFYEGQALFDDIYALLRDEGFQLSGGAMSAATGAQWEQGDFVFKRAA